MSIVRFDPFRNFEGLTRRMNSFMSEFDKGLGLEFGDFSPKVDISEDEKHIYFHAELPGLDKEDVKVTINNDVLIIKGEKKREEKIEENDEDNCFIRVERRFGEFSRSFVLPDNINSDSISAKVNNGVLDISIEKTEPEKPKEVKVEIS